MQTSITWLAMAKINVVNSQLEILRSEGSLSGSSRSEPDLLSRTGRFVVFVSSKIRSSISVHSFSNIRTPMSNEIHHWLRAIREFVSSYGATSLLVWSMWNVCAFCKKKMKKKKNLITSVGRTQLEQTSQLSTDNVIKYIIKISQKNLSLTTTPCATLIKLFIP